MIRSSRIVPFASCLAAAFAAAGCRSDAPLPLPDAARTSGLSLSATPDPLVIRPGSSGRIQFTLRDEQGAPVPDYPLSFAIVDDGSEAGMVQARLSSDLGLTDGNGKAVLEIIVGALASDNSSASLTVTATCQGSAGARADITVTTNTYSVEILPVPASDLLSSVSIVSTRLLFYDDATCGTLDLTNLDAATAKPRPSARYTDALNPTVVFPGVAASASHAVVGLGLDGSGVIQIAGCVDIPGPALLESETIRATLLMDRLFPVPRGTYQVASDFQLSPPPAALAAVRSVWGEWNRCPLDPARLWIDCALDALATDPATDPLDCVPMPGAEGPLGDRLFPLRGEEVAPLSGTPADPSATPCRGQTDGAGNPSLESVVDALFSGTRDQLRGAKLGTFSDEIAALLGIIHIDSQMTIAATSEVNSYAVEHDLLGITFPGAIPPVSFELSDLGLPVSSAAGILATRKADQFSLPSHGFTLRLGTTARYAFEASNLESRGAENSLKLVAAVFGLAQWTDQGDVLSGCSAFDAAVCEQIRPGQGLPAARLRQCPHRARHQAHPCVRRP